MADAATLFRIQAKVEGLSEIEGLKKSVQLLTSVANPSAQSLDQLRKAALELGNAHKASERDIQTAINVLKEVKQQTAVASGEYKLLGRELGDLENRLNAATQSFRGLTSAQNNAASSAQGVRNVFDLTGRGRNLGATQYGSPIGPQQLDYSRTNAALDAMLSAEDQMAALQRRARQQRLEAKEKYNALELAANQKLWSDELKQNQVGFQQELADFDRRLNERVARRERSAARLKAAGQITGAVAAASIFGGPEGFLGSAIGATFGGVPGALTGGAIGAQIGMLRQQAGQVAEYVKNLNLAKITLAQASAGQQEYNKQLQIARNISRDYAVGLIETIKGYSQVAVAAKANGLTLEQTEKIYRGLVSAGVAFGKSQEDLDAIVTATVQVLSKGKLSAEELQGQIGERLPGAVAKFAAATGRTLPELSKALNDGKVTIADFVKFAEKQFNDYDGIAKVIGSSPEKAGERLKIALDTAAENYGGFFQQVGAGLQNSSAKIVSWFNENSEGVKRFATLWINLGKLIADVADGIGKAFQAPLDYIRKIAPGTSSLFGLSGGNGNVVSDIYKRYTSNYNQYFPQFKPSSYGAGSNTAANGGMNAAGSQKSSAEEGLERQRDSLRLTGEAINRQFDNLAIQKKIDAVELNIYQARKRGQDIVATMLEDQKIILQGKLDEKEINDKLALRLAQTAKEKDAEARAQQQTNDRNQADLDIQKVRLRVSQQLKQNAIDINEELAKQDQQKAFNMLSFAGENGLRTGINNYIESLGTLRDAISDVTVNGLQTLEAAIANLTMTGKFQFKEFALSIINDLTRMVTRMMIMAPLMQFIQSLLPGGGIFSGGFLGKSGAMSVSGLPSGNTFGLSSISGKYFANGGVINEPTIFKFANGGAGKLGLMGEAGPEAIIPLRRGRDGKLGVSGGSGTSVVVNVDAKGTSVQGDNSQSAALGRAISSAVQAELIKQRRPGGLLAA